LPRPARILTISDNLFARCGDPNSLELGRALVSRYPDQAKSFLVLSSGYMNRSKIAWKEPDYPAVERHLTQAVEAARQAVALAPANGDARHFLSTCQRRLDDFLKERRQAASQVH
jgi:hypothetical protein